MTKHCLEVECHTVRKDSQVLYPLDWCTSPLRSSQGTVLVCAFTILSKGCKKVCIELKDLCPNDIRLCFCIISCLLGIVKGHFGHVNYQMGGPHPSSFCGLSLPWIKHPLQYQGPTLSSWPHWQLCWTLSPGPSAGWCWLLCAHGLESAQGFQTPNGHPHFTPGLGKGQLKVVGLFLGLESVLNWILLGHIIYGRVLTPNTMCTLNMLEPFWYCLGEQHLLQVSPTGVP